MKLAVKNGEKILFIGDSITDCGRRDNARPLGHGYVKIFSDLVAMREPQKKIAIINKGISGNRALDLRDRWSDDVLRFRPDRLSIMIGINDLHLFLGKAPSAVSPELFRKTLDEILDRTRKTLPRCKILLLTPFYISTDRADGSSRADVLKLLPAYIGIVKAMSRKYRTSLLDTHALFARLLKYHEPDMFCPEPVHPNSTGHHVLAEAVYSAFCR